MADTFGTYRAHGSLEDDLDQYEPFSRDYTRAEVIEGLRKHPGIDLEVSYPRQSWRSRKRDFRMTITIRYSDPERTFSFLIRPHDGQEETYPVYESLRVGEWDGRITFFAVPSLGDIPSKYLFCDYVSLSEDMNTGYLSFLEKYILQGLGHTPKPLPLTKEVVNLEDYEWPAFSFCRPHDDYAYREDAEKIRKEFCEKVNGCSSDTDESPDGEESTDSG